MKDRTAAAIGLALWALVVVLVFLPRIPDAFGGNLWLWLAGYAAVPLLLFAVWRRAPGIREGWGSLPRVGRWLAGLAAVLGTLAATLTLRLGAPVPFGRLSRENGLWEPLCLFLYWGGALLVWREARDAEPAVRRPWLLAIGFFVLMGFEEIDYFSIFGGIFGDVHGVYAGSLHDMIRLVSEGVLTPAGMAIIAALVLAAFTFLWRRGILDPAWVLGLARGGEVVWLLAGLALLAIAAAEEAHLFGWYAADPTPEEAVELGGAVCIAVYALELAAERLPAPVRRRSAPDPGRADRTRRRSVGP